VIYVEKLKKTFDQFIALNEVDFRINAGECFGLLGPNGAGKSTFIHLLYGQSIRTSGVLKVFGLDPTHHSKEIKKKMGLVTQENALDESLTVKENMMIFASFVGLKAKDREPKVKELLQYLNLSHKEHSKIQSLSGGMKRRLVFVRALLNDPELLILDEPTTGLDPAVRHLLWTKVQDLKKEGKTILITTHYMHEAEVLCDKILILNHGKVIAQGKPMDLIKEHSPGYVAHFPLEDLDQIKKFMNVDSKNNYFTLRTESTFLYIRSDSLTNLLQLIEQTHLHPLQLRPANLEDVFLILTGQELQSNA